MDKVTFQGTDFLDAKPGVFYNPISNSIFTLENKDYSSYGSWESDEVTHVPVYDYTSEKGSSHRVAVQFSEAIKRVGDL